MTTKNIETIDTLLHLGDSALIMAQRLSAWCGHGPVLEQDIAITNISLDFLGQARNWYQYAAKSMNKMGPTHFASHIKNDKGLITEDTLAYLRAEREFKNHIICELPNGDWAQTVLKIFLLSSYQQFLFTALQKSTNIQIASIAAKSLKETNYHVRWSSEWVIRLGDGTEESNRRIKDAVKEVWQHTRAFFELAGYETASIEQQEFVDANTFKEQWLQVVNDVFVEATLEPVSIVTGWTGLDGKKGIHTEHLGFILTDMQYLQRTYPNAVW